MSITPEERERRRWAVNNARHSIEMEGGRTDDAMREVEEAYVRGEVSLDDVLAASQQNALAALRQDSSRRDS